MLKANPASLDTCMHRYFFIILLLFTGCSEPPDTGCSEPPDPRIVAKKSFVPKQGMTFVDVMQALGAPDLRESLPLSHISEGKLYFTWRQRLCYGPFAARASDGAHQTKYRLNLNLKCDLPTREFISKMDEASKVNDQKELKRLKFIAEIYHFYSTELDDWSRESPE